MFFPLQLALVIGIMSIFGDVVESSIIRYAQPEKLNEAHSLSFDEENEKPTSESVNEENEKPNVEILGLSSGNNSPNNSPAEEDDEFQVVFQKPKTPEKEVGDPFPQDDSLAAQVTRSSPEGLEIAFERSKSPAPALDNEPCVHGGKFVAEKIPPKPEKKKKELKIEVTKKQLESVKRDLFGEDSNDTEKQSNDTEKEDLKGLLSIKYAREFARNIEKRDLETTSEWGEKIRYHMSINGLQRLQHDMSGREVAMRHVVQPMLKDIPTFVQVCFVDHVGKSVANALVGAQEWGKNHMFGSEMLGLKKEFSFRAAVQHYYQLANLRRLAVDGLESNMALSKMKVTYWNQWLEACDCGPTRPVDYGLLEKRKYEFGELINGNNID